MDIPSILVLCVSETAEIVRSIKNHRIGYQDLTGNMVMQTFYISNLVTERTP